MNLHRPVTFAYTRLSAGFVHAMRFATLGTSPEARRVAQTLVALGHTWTAAVGSGTGMIDETLRPDEKLDSWEDLFRFSRMDVIVVSGGADQDQDEPLRKLVPSTEARLLLLHPVCEAVVAIELEMIRDDVESVLASYCPMREHPAFLTLIELRQQPPAHLGAIQQIVMERRLPERTDVNVIWNLRRDCELLRTLGGKIRHVNGMGESGKGAGFSRLSVNMTPADDDVVLHWSIAPGAPSAKITLQGENGKAELEFSHAECTLQTGRESATFDVHEGERESLASLLASERPSPDWSDIRHSLEVAEAAERSAVKGKTIELYEETYTEESSFKGLMAISGCGLLLLTLLFIFGWSVVESMRFPYLRNEYDRVKAEMQEREERPDEQVAPRTHLLIRLWPVYPFAAFLLLQMLRLVFYDPDKQTEAEGNSAENVAEPD